MFINIESDIENNIENLDNQFIDNLTDDEINKLEVINEIETIIYSKPFLSICIVINDLFNDKYMLNRFKIDDKTFWCITKNISPIVLPFFDTSFKFFNTNINYIIKTWNSDEKRFMLRNSIILSSWNSCLKYAQEHHYPEKFIKEINNHLNYNIAEEDKEFNNHLNYNILDENIIINYINEI